MEIKFVGGGSTADSYCRPVFWGTIDNGREVEVTIFQERAQVNLLARLNGKVLGSKVFELIPKVKAMYFDPNSEKHQAQTLRKNIALWVEELDSAKKGALKPEKKTSHSNLSFEPQTNKEKVDLLKALLACEYPKVETHYTVLSRSDDRKIKRMRIHSIDLIF